MLGARQKLRYLTRKKALVLSKSPLRSTGSRLARAKSMKFTVRRFAWGLGPTGLVAHFWRVNLVKFSQAPKTWPVGT
jgi:hypothetical protein